MRIASGINDIGLVQWMVIATLITASLASHPSAAAPPFYGVNAGAPVSGNSILFSDALGADIESGGCHFVRINFIGSFSGWDASRLALYDTVIQNARNNNLEILAVFSNETVAGFSQSQWNENYNTTGQNAYIDAYAATAWQLINHYKDDIKLFEIWNEPSCWSVNPTINPLNAGCTYIWPRIFANMMAEVYKECIDQGGADFFTTNGVSLVSGGLFAHDIGGTNPASATAYAHDVYNQTDVWTAFQNDPLNPSGRTYPWDYFGYHFYLNSGSAVSTSELDIYFNRNISGHVNDGIRVEQLTHGDTSPIIVTEFGWTTEGVGEQGKADNLTDTFTWMATQSFITAGMWYQWNCCDPNGDWGLTQGIGNPEPGYFALAALTGTPTPPSVDFVGAPVSGLTPLVVNFTNQTVGDVTSYAWDFGDTGVSSDENPQHTYTTPGTYNVTLTATGPGGGDAKTRFSYITASRVISDFSASPLAGVVPLQVQFADQSQGPVTDYDWDFGDGNTSGLANPMHTYAAVGSYTVALTVSSNGEQATETKVDYINVSENFVDLDTNGVIDLRDFARFIECFTGNPPIATPPGCDVAPLVVAPATTSWQTAASVLSLSASIANDDLIEGVLATIESGGFHGVTPGGDSGGLADLTDGVEGLNVEAVLQDFPGGGDPQNRALQVRYEFDPPVHIDRIRVFAANGDGRVFQNYDVHYSQDGDPAYQTLFAGVTSGPFGQSNLNSFGATVTEVFSTTSDPLATHVDALRFVFYPVSGTDNGFRDQYDPGEPGDADGFAEAFESSIIKEIDVIEYDGQLTGNIADFDGDRAADLQDYELLESNVTGP